MALIPVSVSLWLMILIIMGGFRVHSISMKTALAVGASRIYNTASNDAVVTAQGPVPPSDPSPCTYIGGTGGNGNGHPRCPPSTHDDNDTMIDMHDVPPSIHP